MMRWLFEVPGGYSLARIGTIISSTRDILRHIKMFSSGKPISINLSLIRLIHVLDFPVLLRL